MANSSCSFSSNPDLEKSGFYSALSVLCDDGHKRGNLFQTLCTLLSLIVSFIFLASDQCRP